MISLPSALRGSVGSQILITFLRGNKSYACNVSREDLDGPYFSASGPIQQTALRTPNSQQRVNDSPRVSSGSLPVVKIQRRTNETSAAYSTVARALGYIPKTVENELIKWGLTIVITPTISESAKIFASNARYAAFNNTDGYYDDKTIYICERVPAGNGVPKPNRHIVSILLHEIGHAYNDMTNSSDSSVFSSARNSDTAYLSNSERGKYAYYSVVDELYAELFAIAVCPQAEVPEDSKGLQRAFPRCFDVIKKQIF